MSRTVKIFDGRGYLHLWTEDHLYVMVWYVEVHTGGFQWKSRDAKIEKQ